MAVPFGPTAAPFYNAFHPFELHHTTTEGAIPTDRSPWSSAPIEVDGVIVSEPDDLIRAYKFMMLVRATPSLGLRTLSTPIAMGWFLKGIDAMASELEVLRLIGWVDQPTFDRLSVCLNDNQTVTSLAIEDVLREIVTVARVGHAQEIEWVYRKVREICGTAVLLPLPVQPELLQQQFVPAPAPQQQLPLPPASPHLHAALALQQPFPFLDQQQHMPAPVQQQLTPPPAPQQLAPAPVRQPLPHVDPELLYGLAVEDLPPAVSGDKITKGRWEGLPIEWYQPLRLAYKNDHQQGLRVAARSLARPQAAVTPNSPTAAPPVAAPPPVAAAPQPSASAPAVEGPMADANQRPRWYQPVFRANKSKE